MSILFLRVSHLLPSQLPGEHTVVLPHMVQSTFKPFAIVTSFFYLTLEKLETLWLHMNLMVHRWSLMFTGHIDMTAHTPAFSPSQVPLIGMHGVHILPKDVMQSANQQHCDSNPWHADLESHTLSTQPPCLPHKCTHACFHVNMYIWRQTCMIVFFYVYCMFVCINVCRQTRTSVCMFVPVKHKFPCKGKGITFI